MTTCDTRSDAVGKTRARGEFPGPATFYLLSCPDVHGVTWGPCYSSTSSNISGPTPHSSQTKSSGSSGVSTVTSHPQTVQRNVYVLLSSPIGITTVFRGARRRLVLLYSLDTPFVPGESPDTPTVANRPRTVGQRPALRRGSATGPPSRSSRTCRARHRRWGT